METRFWFNKNKNLSKKKIKAEVVPSVSTQTRIYLAVLSCAEISDCWLKLMPCVPICLFPRGGKYSPSIAVVAGIATSSVNDSPTVCGWESGLWVERRETVIMRETSRSNVQSRRTLRNGKPQGYRNESLLILLSILSETVSHGRKWREGGGTFGPTTYFLITLTQCEQ